jgi:hypothetical protein
MLCNLRRVLAFALQLWLLCSIVCDALVAVASQALVADRIGREDEGKDFPYMTEFNILVHAVLAILFFYCSWCSWC